MLVATIAIAADNEGDGQARGAPLAELITTDNIERTAPMDPTAPGGAKRVSRAPTLPMLTTVSRMADAENASTTPPDADVERAFRTGLSSAMTSTGRMPSGGDPAMKERKVFGDDDRINISETDRFPFRAFGYLQILKQDDKIVSCSATLIGPRTVLTAAHCLYDHENGWRKRFVFVPGMKDGSTAPFGAYEFESASIMQGYIDFYQGYYGSVMDWDIGVVTLKQNAGNTAGWLQIAHNPDLAGFTANIIGYPGDKPVGTMWRATCDVADNAIGQLTFTYQCDTFPGSSGSAVYDYDPETKTRYIMGVNVAENQIANTAVRLNAVYFEWVNSHIK